MHKFFVDPNDIHLDIGEIYIKGEDVKHIQRVLRLQEGQNVEIGNGLGTDYTAVIDRIEKDKILTRIVEARRSTVESELRVTLFQSIPKSTKMDLIIQKCTELGVHSIVPINTKRSIVQLDDPRACEKKLMRWRRIAYEAAKQSRRCVIPKVEDIRDLNAIWSQINQLDINIVAYENERTIGIKDLINSQISPIYKNIGIFVGPEVALMRLK